LTSDLFDCHRVCRPLDILRDRYQTTLNALKNIDYSDGVEYAINILSGKYGLMCQYDKALNFETIWSSVFDMTNNKIYRAEGNPLRAKFIEDKRLPKKRLKLW